MSNHRHILKRCGRRSFFEKKWLPIHPGLKLWMCNIPVPPKHLLHKWQVLVPILWQCLVSLFPPDKNAFSHGLYWDIHQPKVCSVFAHTPKPPQKKASLVRTVTIHPKRNWVLPQLIVNQPLPRLLTRLVGYMHVQSHVRTWLSHLHS